MVVGVSVFELHIPHARSLKQKRKVVRSLIERIQHRFRVSILESGHQNLHQRAEIALSAVSLSETESQRLMSSIRQLIESEVEAVLIGWDPESLELAP